MAIRAVFSRRYLYCICTSLELLFVLEQKGGNGMNGVSFRFAVMLFVLDQTGEDDIKNVLLCLDVFGIE